MNNLKNLANKYFFADELPFESRVLNFVCFFGALAAIAAIIARLIAKLPFLTIAPIILFFATVLTMLYISIKKNQPAAILMTIIVNGLSVVFWPVLFFTIGGPGSGMAVYFAFAIILDYTLLKGKTRIVALCLTFAVTVICYVSTLFWGWRVFPGNGLNTYESFIDIMQSIFIVGNLMGLFVIFHVKLFQNEKNKAEAAVGVLEAAQRTVTAIFESNPHMNVMFDSDFRVIDCNPSAYRYVGFNSKEELLGGFTEWLTNSIPLYQSNGRPSRTISEVLMTAVNEGYIKIETELVIQGKTRIIDMEIKRIPYGDSFALLGYMIDLTDAREWERKIARRDALLEEAMEEAKAANLAKSAFLATMSHEIRTPMNSIMGFTELAQGESISPSAKEYLSKISDSTKGLLGIINDVLDISKIESGKMELEKVPFDLHNIFTRCQSIIYPTVAEKGLDLRVYAEPLGGKQLLGDPVRLYQAIMNLLSNAVKFTSAGTVRLTSVIKKADDDSVTIYFEVKDSGIGMTAAQIEKIFDPFTQADSSTTRNYGGTGLGLTITKNIVELMGGSLKVDSELGTGSTFSFELVFEAIETDGDMPEYVEIDVTGKPLFDGTVLICEDNSMNQQVICEHLAKVGLRTVVAENGKIGVEKVQERIRTGEKPFDLIFMDIFMPVMDGVEAADMITALGTGAPIVAMTANVMTNELENYKKCGIYDCVGKPFTTQELWRSLLRHITPVSISYEDDLLQEQANDELQKKLCARFAKDNQYKYADIAEAIAAEDWSAAHRLAHTLKGNAGQIGKTGLQNAAAKIESLLKEGLYPGEEQMNSLKAELNEVLDELKPLLDEAASQADAGNPDTENARALFERLAPMLENINPECVNMLDEIRAIPGTQELARQIEDYDFESAAMTLAQIMQSAVRRPH